MLGRTRTTDRPLIRLVQTVRLKRVDLIEITCISKNMPNAMQPTGPDPEQQLGIVDPVEAAGEAETQKREAKKGTRKRAKKKTANGGRRLEERVAILEGLLASQGVQLHDCHMCHKGGATAQRGNTGEWFHVGCLTRYRAGEDPDAAEPEAEGSAE